MSDRTCVDMTVSELASFNPRQADDLDRLISQLGEGCRARPERVRAAIESPDSHLYVVTETEGEGAIIACATLCICRTPELTIGLVEAVVASPRFRGQGLGKALMDRIIRDAKVLDVTTIRLTSHPSRVAANGLYQSLGFKRKDTNFYTMNL